MTKGLRMLRFGSVKNSSALNIASVPASSTQFRDLVDESVRRLLPRGDWDGTIVPIRVCIQNNGCVVWPRYVGHVRKLNLCNAGVPISNVWYDFLPYSNQHHFSTWWNPNWTSSYWSRWFGSPASITTQAKSPVFTDILGDGRTLRAYISTPLDAGKKLYIFGEDNDGQRLVTKGVGGWTDGITLNLKSPYVESADSTGTALKVRRIERVVKDETQGPVRLYAWNTTTSVLEDVAYYEPSETEPSYVRSQLHAPCCTTTSGTCAHRSVMALVKLAYVPIRQDNDWVLIDNLEAIKNMMQSIRSEDAGDLQSKAAWEAAAIRSLNLGLHDANPDDQVPVSMGSLGRNESAIGSQRVF